MDIQLVERIPLLIFHFIPCVFTIKVLLSESDQFIPQKTK